MTTPPFYDQPLFDRADVLIGIIIVGGIYLCIHWLRGKDR